MKSSALALRCSHPEQLLQFLMSNKDSSNPLDRFNVLAKNRFGSTPVGNNSGVKYNNKNNNSGDITDPFCFNCKERGHVFRKCPKPLVRCNQCHRVGHKVEKCPAKAEDKNNKVANTQNTMCISLANSNSKFYKDVLVNGIPTKAFIDFGSDVCLLARSTSENLMLECGGVPNPIRGFGNNIVYSLGTVNVELIIDGVSAHTNCQVMEDKFLDVPLLVGQTYTEQSHVFVLKTAETLQFIDINSELPFNRTEIDNDRFVKIISIADLEIYGPAVVKAYTEPKLDGPVIIENKVIGRPMFQYFVFGGVYTSKSGFINIYIMPISGYCSLYRGTIISRASSVQAVNRIMNELNDPVTDPIEISKVRIGDDVNDADKAKLLKLLNKEDVKDKIDEEQVKQKERYDKSRRLPVSIRKGSWSKLVIRTLKMTLLPQYTGPYRVISVLGNDRYRIVAIPGLSSSKHKRKTTVAADRMQPWVHVAALDLNDSDNDSEIEEHDE
ncbi:hypothetical protein SFRURICE_018351 [Spodoptera frugiperda]|nr:hypothetical protein SFRURICE_018351 [Spodoptera frugiperda]